MDLSPREVVPSAPPARVRRRRWPAVALLVAVLAGGGVVLTQFLTSSIDYYCNVDEVGEKAGCETGRRLRVQGNVEEGSVAVIDGVTSFTVAFNGVEMPVRYEGDPGGVFQECVPVVVHGRVVDDAEGTGATNPVKVFEGDRIEVKHSNEYVADNSDRIDQALDACSLQG